MLTVVRKTGRLLTIATEGLLLGFTFAVGYIAALLLASAILA